MYLAAQLLIFRTEKRCLNTE